MTHPPPPTPKRRVPKWVVILSLVVSAFLVIGIAASCTGTSTEETPKKDQSQEQTDPPKKEEENPPPKEEPKKDVAVFKVWGSAPHGVDTSYGSDTESHQGPSTPSMTRQLPVNEDSLYYQVSSQLMGGGDIKCSVTIGDKTRTGHATGGYNICSVQLDSDLLGGFS